MLQKQSGLYGDVAYDRLFTNGRVRDEQPAFKAGDTVRLRIINGSSSTYFWLRYSGGSLTVIANPALQPDRKYEPVCLEYRKQKSFRDG